MPPIDSTNNFGAVNAVLSGKAYFRQTAFDRGQMALSTSQLQALPSCELWSVSPYYGVAHLTVGTVLQLRYYLPHDVSYADRRIAG